MSKLKKTIDIDVYSASKKRIEYVFNNFERVYLSFSGGKDSTTMFHVVAEVAQKMNKRFGVLIIDLEAQYKATIENMRAMVDEYSHMIDLHWVCLPIKLRNAVSNFQPTWCCWDGEKRDKWVRNPPECAITDSDYYPFFVDRMEFEEFMVLWGDWYANGKTCAGLVGIRADESLNRFRTIASSKKSMHNNHRWTTQVVDGLYNAYPIYDWKTSDIWAYHAKFPHKRHNEIYDLMHKAGLTPHQMRLCQPYGDDQKRGLWLYQILEPETWGLVLARVAGANSGAKYVTESGNITGHMKIEKPAGHTWKSFCNLLLATMPAVTRDHYLPVFRSWLRRWQERGYYTEIPDEAPRELENKKWVPSWRRLCKVLLRNDWWCKGLGLTQPKSEAYAKFLEIKKSKKET